MGLTERHWFENEDVPENYEWDLEDAVYNSRTNKRRGRWIDEGFYADGHGYHAYRCSECENHIIAYEPDDYCKYCGADMRG